MPELPFKKITSLFAFQEDTSNCSEETGTERSIQEPVTNHFELQETDTGTEGLPLSLESKDIEIAMKT